MPGTHITLWLSVHGMDPSLFREREIQPEKKNKEIMGSFDFQTQFLIPTEGKKSSLESSDFFCRNQKE